MARRQDAAGRQQLCNNEWPLRAHTQQGTHQQRRVRFYESYSGNMAPRARLPWAGGLHCFAKQCKRKAVQIDVSHNYLVSGLLHACRASRALY